MRLQPTQTRTRRLQARGHGRRRPRRRRPSDRVPRPRRGGELHGELRVPDAAVDAGRPAGAVRALLHAARLSPAVRGVCSCRGVSPLTVLSSSSSSSLLLLLLVVVVVVEVLEVVVVLLVSPPVKGFSMVMHCRVCGIGVGVRCAKICAVFRGQDVVSGRLRPRVSVCVCLSVCLSVSTAVLLHRVVNAPQVVLDGDVHDTAVSGWLFPQRAFARLSLSRLSFPLAYLLL